MYTYMYIILSSLYKPLPVVWEWLYLNVQCYESKEMIFFTIFGNRICSLHFFFTPSSHLYTCGANRRMLNMFECTACVSLRSLVRFLANQLLFHNTSKHTCMCTFRSMLGMKRLSHRVFCSHFKRNLINFLIASKNQISHQLIDFNVKRYLNFSQRICLYCIKMSQRHVTTLKQL